MKKSFYIGWISVFILILVLCVLFIVVADKSGFWNSRNEVKEVAGVIFGALLLLIASVATMGMQSQHNFHEKRQMALVDSKIAVFREFLTDLDNIIRDKKIDKNEEYALQIKLSYLSLHIRDLENMMKISSAISDIVVKLKNEHNEDKGIMIELMEITDVMYKELYDKDVTTKNKNQTLNDMRDEMVLDFYSINVPPEDITSYRYVVKRIRNIKKVVADCNKNGKLYDRQWVYNGYTLVHDLYTDKGKKADEYVCNDRSHKYTVDLVFNAKGDSIVIDVFSRENSHKATLALLEKMNKTKDVEIVYSQDAITADGHFLYKSYKAYDEEDEHIANDIVKLLRVMAKCRQNKEP